jgi:hypothetical protein
MDKKDLAKAQEEFLARSRPPQKEKKLATHKETQTLIGEKKSMADIAEARGMTLETIVSHIEKLIEEESRTNMEYLKYEIPRAQFLKIEKAIDELLKEGKVVLLTPVKNKVGPNVSFLHIRLARALLGHTPKSEGK